MVAGTYLSWFDLKDFSYIEFTRRRAGDVYDAQPDYVIWGGSVLDQSNFSRLRDELGVYLKAHADTSAVASSPCYGSLVLLKPDWQPAEGLNTSWERWGMETKEQEK